MENRKKILIVSAPFYPQNSPRANRATELAKEFARQGHDVKVLTVFGDANYNIIAKDFGISISNLGRRKWKSPKFGKSKIGYFLTRAFLRFLSLTIEFPNIELTFMVKRALTLENNYDLMISSAVPYPVHWGVAASRKKNHQIAKIWIADCGDPYMGCKTDSFNKLFYFKFIEKWFMHKTDFISVPTEGSIDGYYHEFHHKIKVIPQGFNFNEAPIYQGVINNSVPTFAYAGGFIPKIRDPHEFLEFLININIPYKFIIYTRTANIVRPFALKSNGQIEVLEYISRNDLLFRLSQMDFLVNFTNGTGVQTPSKLIDYALTKRPILSVGSINSNFKNAEEFLKANYDGRQVIDNLEQYNIQTIVSQFLKLLELEIIKNTR
ncbi:MAG TPA: hypothetical protein VFC67_18440 [Prolixibacteraceae bacterium]|nr:hypothetical protein [Prolixibacteraceae bacterium]